MLSFDIHAKLPNGRGRAGTIQTSHGAVETPAFIVVGTKATVKALTPEQISSLGAQAVLANTYHLYLQPGEEILKKAGGFPSFMNWKGPTFTDSGGFQAFSLGAAFNKTASKIGQRGGREKVLDDAGKYKETRYAVEGQSKDDLSDVQTSHAQNFAKVTEDGVEFRSILDGSTHFFTPERSMDIQHTIGADIMFAFDECTSPLADHEYQKEAMDRTHRWAARSLEHHKKTNEKDQALFGIVQGGRHEDLRKESARTIGAMDFDGFGIGGSFEKEDIATAVGWVVDELSEGKPRHLLGIGAPEDIILGIENGIDTFDCVAPTRIARNGAVYVRKGKNTINLLNAEFKADFTPIEAECGCYTCKNYTKAYLAHLFRAKEMLAATLASIHNLYFLVHLAKNARKAIINGTWKEFKSSVLG
ncbi:MAG: tRNA guanosine(34) transglycosylase Tgt [Candidatus Pacebacteria bacterium]|nr:tRNA guanosine(34) transglycosylase Tgt [Candidatus Paceibacterota bacterium]